MAVQLGMAYPSSEYLRGGVEEDNDERMTDENGDCIESEADCKY